MMRRSILFVAALVLLVAATRAQRHPSLVVEDSYRQALGVVAAGGLGSAVETVVALEERSSADCLHAIELHTAKVLVRREPEALVPQAFLRLSVAAARAEKHSPSIQLYGFQRVSIRTVEQLAELYLAKTEYDAAPSLVAGLFTYLGVGVGGPRSAPRLAATRELLQSALALDSDHLAARHSLAVTLELDERPGLAIPHLEQLLAHAPEEPRFRIRYAVVTVKTGRRERGRALLEALTGDGELWVRELATQELARLLLASGEGEEAEALLRRGLGELPREKIALQLAALLDPRWDESWQVLEPWLGEVHRASGPSARWVYERGAQEEIEALQLELVAAVSDRRGFLREGLERLPKLPDSRRQTFAGCR